MKAAHLAKYKKLGLKISYYRKLRGYTQEQFAEKLDKNVSFIGAVEAPNIDRTISLDTLFDIADVLDIPAYKLLNFDDD
ncbi:MAG: helix-turn-helix transcriptional regulator [Defluviitaleaceae bacterium]|nr:helix-turn-helix transcriptional regulator [Defluviitaleaceae bacterium]